MNVTSIVCQMPGLYAAPLGDQLAMLGLEQGQYYSLNRTASRVWTLLAEPVAVATICETLHEEFDVAKEACEADVLALLEELAQERLVRIVE